MSRKKKIMSSGVVLAGILLGIGIAIHANLIILPFVQSSEARYLDGLDDDRVLVGISHNIFVGKVLKKVGQTAGEAGPLTQFEVQIVNNVNGLLSGKVVINQ